MMDICQCKNNGFPGRKFRRRLARVSSLNGESADLASSTKVSPTKPVSEDAKPKNGGSQSSSDSSDSENNDED